MRVTEKFFKILMNFFGELLAGKKSFEKFLLCFLLSFMTLLDFSGGFFELLFQKLGVLMICVEKKEAVFESYGYLFGYFGHGNFHKNSQLGPFAYLKT